MVGGMNKNNTRVILTRTRSRAREFITGPSATGGYGVTRTRSEATTFDTKRDAERATYVGGCWRSNTL